MYCTNCGQQMDDRAVLCVKCGVNTGVADSYCRNCGSQTQPGANVCTSCGVPIYRAAPAGAKSKMVAGLLGIFLGALGVHNFYLGYTGKAVAQLLIGVLGSILVVGPLVSGVWGLIEGIMILSGSIDKDAAGVPLGE